MIDVEKPVVVRKKDAWNDLMIYRKELVDMSDDKKEKQCILRYPTVYIHVLKDAKGRYEVYVGESNDVFSRNRNHFATSIKDPSSWQNRIIGSKKSVLYVIGHPHFTKSMTLDVENKLIHYLSAVECVKYVANDRDNDQSDYYTSDEFLAVFDRIWRELGKMDKRLFPDFGTIKDSAIFKSSPFHKLYPDQLEAKANIEMIIKNALEDTTAPRGQLIFIEGASGTGKTVLNSTLFYDLCMETKEDSNQKRWNCHLVVNHDEQLKVYEDIRNKLMISSIDDDFVSKSSHFIMKYYRKDKATGKIPDVDVVFVDEAHLLLSQKNQAYTNSFDQIEAMRKIARVVVIMFDQRQVMHIQDYWDPVYVDALRQEAKNQAARTGISYYYKLTEQLRISGSEDTVNWITDFTDKHIIGKIPDDPDYEIKIFDSPFDMEKVLKKKAQSEEHKLSRIISTFDWPYSSVSSPTNGKPHWMVSIDTKAGLWENPWNRELTRNSEKRRRKDKRSWAEQPQTIGEVGSTFTIQGADLSVAAVILGPSVSFKNGMIYFDKSKHKDIKAIHNRTMPNGSPKCFAEMFIDNEVNVLMKRGVHALYIYAVDDDLREALLEAAE